MANSVSVRPRSSAACSVSTRRHGSTGKRCVGIPSRRRVGGSRDRPRVPSASVSPRSSTTKVGAGGRAVRAVARRGRRRARRRTRRPPRPRRRTMASSTTIARARVDAEQLGGAGGTSPGRACRRGPRSTAVTPSTTTANRAVESRPPASTVRAFFDDDTIACGTPARSSRSSTAPRAGVRRRCRRGRGPR